MDGAQEDQDPDNDEYDEEVENLSFEEDGHLRQPLGKQPIELTMQAVGIADLSAI